jgi:16S rRNA G966 N2-methylase RsmD
MEKHILLKIFPPINDLSLLNYDNEGLWSITLPSDADTISQIICTELSSNIVIFDGTAGIGGNTISFSKFFKKVIGVELNSDRYHILESNIKAYKLENVELINGNCIDYCINQVIDAYFFDPPWGGPNYKSNTKIRIKLGQFSLLELVQLIKTHNDKMIFIKLPNNYDLEEFILFNYRVIKIPTKGTKYQLLII